ncbi:MAG: hypothetical protein ACRBEQ_04145 [Hyphomonas sp.]
MKYHLMMAAGITLFVTFAYRFAMALSAPGLGWQEAYLLGGMLLGGFVIRNGFVAWRRTRGSGDASE